MPRTWDADLQTIFGAYKRRDFLDIYLNDGNALYLSRGAVTRTFKGNPVEYSNWIRAIGDMIGTIDQSVDHLSIDCQNISSDLGLDLASNLRLLDYAFADYWRQYQSLRNPALIQDIQTFRGVLANAEADEARILFELIADHESVGAILASRGLSPRCWWTYQNGIECTSPSGLSSCPHTRSACVDRSVEHEFGGWEFFEQPVASPPGGGGDGGGIGGGTCFTLDTPIWLPTGDVPIGELPLGRLQDPIPLVSFDPITGEICYTDEILEVWEHDAVGHFTFDFDGRVINPTPEHRLWIGFNRFRAADKFKLGFTSRVYADKWSKPKLGRIRWNSDKPVKVRNLTGRKNRTYFANRFAVSNRKNDDGDIPL